MRATILFLVLSAVFVIASPLEGDGQPGWSENGGRPYGGTGQSGGGGGSYGVDNRLGGGDRGGDQGKTNWGSYGGGWSRRAHINTRAGYGVVESKETRGKTNAAIVA